MNLQPIRSAEQYEAALKRIETIIDARRGTAQGDELEALASIVEQYEEENFPIPDPDSSN
jgi:HTH-type transcriptional regulator/antitoxin HigA